MLQKKICMVGSFAVGKTSLVARYVRGIFSESYLTTVGVKIDERVVQVASGAELKLVLWDLQGEDDLQGLRRSYLRGAAGAFLVADGTRPDTVERAVELGQVVREVAGDVPLLLLINKADLDAEWAIDSQREAALSEGWTVLRTSAKTGAGVEEAFQQLSELLLGAADDPPPSGH